MRDLVNMVRKHKEKKRELEPEVVKDVQEVCDWLIRLHRNPAAWDISSRVPFGIFASAMRISTALDEEKK